MLLLIPFLFFLYFIFILIVVCCLKRNVSKMSALKENKIDINNNDRSDYKYTHIYATYVGVF